MSSIFPFASHAAIAPESRRPIRLSCVSPVGAAVDREVEPFPYDIDVAEADRLEPVKLIDEPRLAVLLAITASQIRRAVVSIPANIAEGQARRHTKEFLQALFIARGSLAELETLLVISQRLGYLTQLQLRSLEEALTSVRPPLLGLIKRLKI
jgi:four helix bundle protein